MPGVLSAFDERGCAVIDTLRDQWFYFTGDDAWVWETVQVTGTTGHLDTREEVESLHSFVDSGLMLMEDDTTSFPFSSLEPAHIHEYEETHGPTVGMTRLSRITLHQAWIMAAFVERRSLCRILRSVRRRRSRSHSYFTHDAASRLHLAVATCAPGWTFHTGSYRQRSVALATVIAADLMDARIDLSFGISHTEQASAWWCTTPEGPVGRPEDVLAVSSV